jgi:hypothetical protein
LSSPHEFLKKLVMTYNNDFIKFIRDKNYHLPVN